MEAPFKVGQRVKCLDVNGNWLVFGSIYTIKTSGKEYTSLEEDPVIGREWFTRRFVLDESENVKSIMDKYEDVV